MVRSNEAGGTVHHDDDRFKKVPPPQWHQHRIVQELIGQSLVSAKQKLQKSSRKCCGVLSPSQFIKAASRRRAAPGSQCWGRRKAGGCICLQSLGPETVASSARVWSPTNRRRGVFAKGKAQGSRLFLQLQIQCDASASAPSPRPSAP
jgi:hypothetical protein